MSDVKPFDVDTPEQMLLGQLAVHFDLVTSAVLSSLLSQQEAARDEGRFKPLGEMLVEGGHLDIGQRDHIVSLQHFLRTRHADRDFAQLVLETGYITDDEVDYAFKAQEAAFQKNRSVRSVGDLLVEFGSIDDEMRDDLLSKQGRG